MKALKSSVPVAELQKLIRQWKSRKITDSAISKLLDLYLGLTAYMNEERVYPIENFYDIRLSLRFPTTQMLVETVKRSRSFCFVTDGDGHIRAFYSPLWCERRVRTPVPECGQASVPETNQASVPNLSADSTTKMNRLSEPELPQASTPELPQASAQELPQAFAQELPQAFAQELPQAFAVDNIYNIYTKGDEGFSDEKQAATQESLASAKEFFHLVNETPAQKVQALTPLINWFQLHEGLTRKHACENLVHLVNELLVPYFAAQERFMKTGHVGRLCRLNNLMKTSHGKEFYHSVSPH